MTKRAMLSLFVIWGLLALVACGGGGGGDDGTIGTGVVELAGTAAIGKPLAEAEVVVKDRNGKKRSGKTDANGKYKIDVSDMTEPYLVKVDDNEKVSSRTLYAAAATHGVANLHPLSDAACRNWFSVRGRDVDDEFDGDGEVKDPPQENELTTIRDAIRALLRIAYERFGVGAAFDFGHTPFDADGTGFDRLLDHLTITIEKNKITIRLRDPATGIQGTIIIAFGLDQSLADPDNASPTGPTGLAAIPAGTSGIVVIWNSSQDNIGVAGYNVYRDDALVATTPYPVFSDTGLSETTQYCYAVEAFDGAGNVSAKTANVCATTLGTPDTLAPAVPQNPSASATGTHSIAVAWLPSPQDDVLGYDVYRGPSGAANTKIATTVASGYTDTGLVGNTLYCYQFRAFDAALNRSDYSAEICTITQPDIPPTDTTAPASSASPAGGTFQTGQSVTLSCTDAGDSGCAAIYYTVDGGEPSTFSAVYNQPLRLSASATLRFFAIDHASNEESTKHTETYVIDNGNPDTAVPTNTTGANFIDGGTASTSATNVTLGIAATDNVAVTAYCAKDNGTGTAPSPDATCWRNITAAASYTGVVSHDFSAYANNTDVFVYVWFRDAANQVSAVATDSITFVAAADLDAPNNTTAANFIDGGAGDTADLTVTLNLAATDNVAVTAYYVSSGIGPALPAVLPAPNVQGWTSITATPSYSAIVNYTFTVAPNSSDVLTAHVWFKDAAGNVSQVVSDSIVFSTAIVPPIFSDNYENTGLGDWSADNGAWEVGAATSGPNGCYNSSTQCAATVLAGNYPNHIDSRLVSPAIQLPTVGSTEQLQLRFWHWFAFGAYDAGWVQISVQSAPGVWDAWVDVTSYGWSTTGVTSTTWTRPLVDLSAYADKTVRLAFQLRQTVGSGSGVSSGWYVDDVTVTKQ